MDSPGSSPSPEHGIERRRVLLARADGCQLILALDAIEAVLPLDPGPEGEGTLRHPAREHGSAPPIEWWDLTGATAPAGDPGDATPDGASLRGFVLVIRTTQGRRGLRVDAVEAIREVSLAALAPRRTRLVDGAGRTLCLVGELDGQPCFVLDPRILESAPEGR